VENHSKYSLVVDKVRMEMVERWEPLVLERKASRGGGCLIGELAPLLSILGHQMHKHHKSVATLIWMCVAALGGFVK
jgi:hypothetical protein